jgi:signal transduction histidine kinase
MALHLGAMVAGSLVIGLVAVLGIDRLHQDMGVAVQGYQELRQVYDVGFQVAIAKRALRTDQPDVAGAALEMAATTLAENAPPWLNESDRRELQAQLQQARAALNPSNDPRLLGGSPLIAIDRLFSRLSTISTAVRTTIAAKEAAALAQRRQTLAILAALSAAIVFIAFLVGLRLYRAVVIPLDHIRIGVRRFAAGQWDQRVNLHTRDRELVTLAGDFNHMADELRTLYRDLEQKVAARSQELVRSERLASIGYLAAGVAHEINNPLGIIAGYGERAMQRLDRGLDETTLPKTREALAIMCEEAFRCRAITDRLLTLARPGSSERRQVSLAAIAQEVISVLGGMGEYAERRIHLVSDPAEDCTVPARDGEIKQVLLNLLVNALEATPRKEGRVRVIVKRKLNQVEMIVEDNGKGMDKKTLERVFEPFFTDKTEDQTRHGTGLGLSIVHAIVTDHDGSIRAESDGPGCGSRFRVCFPAFIKECVTESAVS